MRERKIASAGAEERERQRQRETETETETERIPSRLWAISAEPNTGLNIMNREIMT